MEIMNREHLETLYNVVRDTWELFQQDFEGDPELEFSSDYENLTLLHEHLKGIAKIAPTIIYPYEISFHKKVMHILLNENECALEKLRNKSNAKITAP